jgi:MFS family permease
MFRVLSFARHFKRDRHYNTLQFALLYFVWSISFALFEYFAPLYLDSLNLQVIIIGLILSGSSFISFFVDPFLGYLQERFSPRFLLTGSAFLFTLNMLLFLYSGNYVFLLFLATNIYGIAFDLFSITTYKGVFDNSIEEDRSTNLSFLESLHALGLLIGAILAGFAMAANFMYAAYISLAILAVLVIFILLTKNVPVVTSDPFSLLKSYRDVWRELRTLGPRGLFLVSLLIVIFLFDGFFFVFEPLFAQKFTGHVVNEYVIGGFLLALYNLPIILLSSYFGRLEDRIGRKRFVLIGLGVACLSVFMLQAVDSLVLTGGSIFFASLGLFSIARPSIEGLYEALTQQKLGVGYNGYSASIMEITLSIGFLFGPLVGGLFISTPEGFNFAFRIFSLLILIFFVLSFFFIRNQTEIGIIES